MALDQTNEKMLPRMNENLKMGPWADKKDWKTRPRAEKNFDIWDLKVSDSPPSPSLPATNFISTLQSAPLVPNP